jgi:hypothetical protein
MNLLHVNFQELYERHLCRHSQYGINVIHLATVIGTYLALFGIAAWLFESWWVVPAIALPYLAVLAFNIPFRVLAVTLVFLGLFFALFFMLFFPLPSSPLLPVAGVILIILCHQIQNWSHKIYTLERDMTEFNKKYKKGPVLFVLLLVYELPILLNYLVFGRKDWCASSPGLGTDCDSAVRTEVGNP